MMLHNLTSQRFRFLIYTMGLLPFRIKHWKRLKILIVNICWYAGREYYRIIKDLNYCEVWHKKCIICYVRGTFLLFRHIREDTQNKPLWMLNHIYEVIGHWKIQLLYQADNLECETRFLLIWLVSCALQN